MASAPFGSGGDGGVEVVDHHLSLEDYLCYFQGAAATHAAVGRETSLHEECNYLLSHDFRPAGATSSGGSVPWNSGQQQQPFGGASTATSDPSSAAAAAHNACSEDGDTTQAPPQPESEPQAQEPAPRARKGRKAAAEAAEAMLGPKHAPCKRGRAPGARTNSRSAAARASSPPPPCGANGGSAWFVGTLTAFNGVEPCFPNSAAPSLSFLNQRIMALERQRNP